MVSQNYDPLVFDYTWKLNRLSKDKQALKNSMLNVISKKPKVKDQAQTNAAAQTGANHAANQTDVSKQ
jgi:hypothetical protein